MINVGFTILAVRILDKVGWRPLLLIELIGMTISLALLGVVFSLGSTSGAVGLRSTVCLGLYIASFAISLGLVLWLMI